MVGFLAAIESIGISELTAAALLGKPEKNAGGYKYLWWTKGPITWRISAQADISAQ